MHPAPETDACASSRGRVLASSVRARREDMRALASKDAGDRARERDARSPRATSASVAVRDARGRAIVKIQNAVRRYMRRKRSREGADATERVMMDVRERALKCGLLVLTWFATSTGLAMFNKQILGAKRGGFPAPLFLTSMQFAIQFVLARIAVRAWVTDHAERKRGRREEVPHDVYWRAVAPVGATMGLDIALSNLSLVFITVSVYTVAKTSSIVFTLLLAFVFRFERPTWFLGAVVAMVTVGQIMSAEGDAQFDVLGFCICLTAALMSALRWTLAQRVMHRDSNAPGDHAKGIKETYLLDHPVVFVYLVYPLMWAVVFVFSCLKEQWWYTIPHYKWLSNLIDVFVDMVIFGVGALMAFCLTLAEFELLNETSALTMMMFGVVKDIAAILLSMVVFGDTFGMTNVAGLILCLAGVIGYNKYKWVGMKNRALASGKLDADAETDADDVPLVDVVAAPSSNARRRSNDGFSIA